MRNIWAFISGSLFGIGLMISGMTDTSKVQGWLDIFGQWDPTLAFVLGGAMIPMAVAWRVAAHRQKSVLGTVLPKATHSKVGAKIVSGSFLFGMGWGLVGLCPGPAMASLSYNGVNGLVFLAAMLAGMLIAVPAKRLYPENAH